VCRWGGIRGFVARSVAYYSGYRRTVRPTGPVALGPREV
jgi:hypothetical protein